MKKDMPLEGLRWSRDSGSALYDTPQTAVLGRAGGLNYKDLIKVTKKREHNVENIFLNFAKSKTYIIFAAHFNTSIDKSV